MVYCTGIIALFVISAVFIVIKGSRRNKEVNQAWESFAASKGLTYALKGRPSLSGKYRGWDVKQGLVDLGVENSVIYTQTTVIVRNTPLVLKINLAAVINLFGPSRNYLTGNKAFDEKFKVNTNQPDLTRFILTAEIQAALLQNIPYTIRINQGTLVFTRYGINSLLVDFESQLDLVCRMGYQIATWQPAPAAGRAS